MSARSDHPGPKRLWRLPTWLLNHLASHGNRLVRDNFGDLARRAPYAVLAALEEVGLASQADLSRVSGVDRGDMVALLNELEADGMATRAPDPADRRRNSIAITPAGRRHLASLDAQVEAAQRQLLEPLSERERAQFVTMMQRLLAYHDESSSG